MGKKSLKGCIRAGKEEIASFGLHFALYGSGLKVSVP